MSNIGKFKSYAQQIGMGTEEIPYREGFCKCGCGRVVTRIALRNHERIGTIAGKPFPYYGNHHQRPVARRPLFYRGSNGRWFIKTRNGREYWYRIVMAEQLGRPLRSDEVVHHKDGDYTNDVLSNLELVDHASHRVIHGEQDRGNRPPCSKCGADRRWIKNFGWRDLCERCYRQTPERAAVLKARYEENKEKIKAGRDARRARQRATGQRVT